VQVSIMMACLIMTDYLRKIIVQGRSSKTTKVGDIMTEEVCLLLYNTCCWFFVGRICQSWGLNLSIFHVCIVASFFEPCDGCV
jgi:hypothetical protein